MTINYLMTCAVEGQGHPMQDRVKWDSTDYISNIGWRWIPPTSPQDMGRVNVFKDPNKEIELK